MAGLNDMIRSAFPGGNVGKPLMIALGALLASGVLTRGSTGQTASAGSQPATDTNDAGGLLNGLGGLLNKLQQGGLGNQTNSWVGSGKTRRFPPINLSGAWPQYRQDTVSADGPLRRRSHQTVVAGNPGNREHIDSKWQAPDCCGAI